MSLSPFQPPMTCPRCGRRGPAFYFASGVCDDCRWDAWIPRDYAAREKYVYDPAWKHANATRRPPLGVAFLDARASIRCERDE